MTVYAAHLDELGVEFNDIGSVPLNAVTCGTVLVYFGWNGVGELGRKDT